MRLCACVCAFVCLCLRLVLVFAFSACVCVCVCVAFAFAFVYASVYVPAFLWESLYGVLNESKHSYILHEHGFSDKKNAVQTLYTIIRAVTQPYVCCLIPGTYWFFWFYRAAWKERIEGESRKLVWLRNHCSTKVQKLGFRSWEFRRVCEIKEYCGLFTYITLSKLLQHDKVFTFCCLNLGP